MSTIMPLPCQEDAGRKWRGAWYVAQTQPRREARAASELGKQSYQVFLPCYLKQRRHARRLSTVAMPLFPGYVFVGFDAAVQRWRAINGTVGVVRLVTTADSPAPIAAGVVEGLMALRDMAGYIALRQRPNFVAGEKVRVAGGSFEDALGLFEEFKDHDRVAILLDLLGRKVRVLIEGQLIEKAS